MADVILLKLGGSLITQKDRPRTARGEVIARLAEEIVAAGVKSLVLGHGSGSFGHVAAARAGIGAGPVAPEGLAGVAETQAEAAELHRMVVGALREAGARPFSFVPGSFLVGREGHVEGTLPPGLPVALRSGFLPVVYGDVVMDSEWGAAIAPTEAVFVFLARELLAAGFTVRRAIWLGETAGLLDSAGRTIPEIHPDDWDTAVRALRSPRGTDVTGGMGLRLVAAAALSDDGIPSLLADGTVPGLLERALRGETVPGTLIV